jgi:hypothetical protein
MHLGPRNQFTIVYTDIENCVYLTVTRFYANTILISVTLMIYFDTKKI